jgi:hypothetical protein
MASSAIIYISCPWKRNRPLRSLFGQSFFSEISEPDNDRACKQTKFSLIKSSSQLPTTMFFAGLKQLAKVAFVFPYNSAK